MARPPSHSVASDGLTIREVADRLGVSTMTAYRAAAAGEIPSIRIGRRRIVPRAAFEAMLATATQPDARDRNHAAG